MKKKIVLKRFSHRGSGRIRFAFDWDDDTVALIRKINGSRYSSTNKCWYADDNEETLKQILQIFSEKADVDISALAEMKNIHRVEKAKEVLPVSKHEEVLSREPETPDAAEDIVPDKNQIEKAAGYRRFDPVEFRINEEDGRLVIRFTGRYDQEWIREMNTFGEMRWDKRKKEFLLPWSVLTVDSLSDYFSHNGVEVKVIKVTPSEPLKIARKDFGEEIRGRELKEKAVEGLENMKKYMNDVRYSERTSESYLTLLEFFFRYFNDKDPMKVTGDEISEFIHNFIVTHGYSASYQNQMISAIKTYYKISGRKRLDPMVFERPRRSRALPKVFSKDEVKRILNATRNNKHKVLLWMIYSCGLRRSEVTNIMLNDLDRDRGVLHVREGKGRVDRVVPVSGKVWEKLDEYIDGFGPDKYLFEGQAGGRYSVESVYQVFKQALRKAGIKKEVGVHSLRHSYATHLHESGLDIRYIQELLGHKSTRTTEVYTHVSRRNLVAVRSPIEDIDVK